MTVMPLNPHVSAHLAVASGAGGPTGRASEAAAGTLIEYVEQGGTIGFIIILLSLVALTLVISQLLTLRLRRLAPDAQVEDLRAIMRARDVDRAIGYCREAEPETLLTRTLGSALVRMRRSAFGPLELPTAIEEVGRHEIARLSRITDLVGLFASIAPMLGLLGTVVGMVGAFDVIARTEGPVRPDSLAGNISQALVTTVMGLIVAIPTTAAYTYLRGRIEQLAVDAGDVIEELASLLTGPAAASQASLVTASQTQQPGVAPPPARPGAPGRPAVSQSGVSPAVPSATR